MVRVLLCSRLSPIRRQAFLLSSSFRPNVWNCSARKALNLKVVDLEMTVERCILDPVGYLTMSLCVLVFVNDRYRTHSPTIYGWPPLQGNPGIDAIYRERTLRIKFLESFILKRRLVSEAMLSFATIVLTGASLLNFIERSFMVPFLLKFLLIWFISSYFFCFFYNL